MQIRREGPVRARLFQLLTEHPGPDPGRNADPRGPLAPGTALSQRRAVHLFESALQSRLQDLVARELKDRGVGYYTIGSSGHEANAVFGDLLRIDDPAFLHYRSAAFLIARARHGRGETSTFDSMLSFVASAHDPVSGGRHKVLGSKSLFVPPQTSTIASHLPKAVGYAYAIARMERLGLERPVPEDAIVYCSFGDASSNHATAQAGFNAAAAARMHKQPCPVMFVCEDNGIGISTRTPEDFIEQMFSQRAGLKYFQADGRDFAAAFTVAQEAIDYCRRTRRPVFFHLKTVRLMGHAGTDVESLYRTAEELDAVEARDPLIAFGDQLLRSNAIARDELLAMYDSMEARIQRAAAEAETRPHLQSAAEVTAPLQLPDPESITSRIPDAIKRRVVFRERLPEKDTRGRHLAFRLAQGLKDLMIAYPEIFVFGEDVAKKGGVYHVTQGIYEAFRAGRIFNTILDETTILGLAQGMAHAGCLPFPEIQYLAYVHNALDQIRGEAASLQFFSDDQWRNPMVVRIAGYGYQKGFGGHFHNDNSIGALLDIPGLIIASPARPDDAVRVLRTCTAAAAEHGKVCVFLEPIALYMTKDLHETGDGLWQSGYPAPEETAPLGCGAIYEATANDDLVIVSYANGLWMSLRVQKRLAAKGVRARVFDLRWLAPMPVDQVADHALETGRVLVVDECRQTHGGPSAHLVAALAEREDLRDVKLRRVAAVDSFVPLGPAAHEVMLQEDDIERAALAMLENRVTS